jgi:hypothetical protein
MGRGLRVGRGLGVAIIELKAWEQCGFWCLGNVRHGEGNSWGSCLGVSVSDCF